MNKPTLKAETSDQDCRASDRAHLRNAPLIRVLDILLAFLMLPFLLAITLPLCVVKLMADGFPLFYNSRRIGLDGASFTVYKFRTMVNDRGFIESELASLNQVGFEVVPTSSPVYTPLGRFFERFQIVEFPQLLNVLKGDMSLVGYRPLPKRHCAELENQLGAATMAERHRYPPGVTGITQLIGKAKLGNLDRVRWENASSRFLYGGASWRSAIAVYFLVLVGTLLAAGLHWHPFTSWILRRVAADEGMRVGTSGDKGV